MMVRKNSVHDVKATTPATRGEKVEDLTQMPLKTEVTAPLSGKGFDVEVRREDEKNTVPTREWNDSKDEYHDEQQLPLSLCHAAGDPGIHVRLKNSEISSEYRQRKAQLIRM